MIELRAAVFMSKLEHLDLGKTQDTVFQADDLEVAIWNHILVQAYPKTFIDENKGTREWVDYHFKSIRWFFYAQVLIQMAYLIILAQVVLYKQDQFGFRFYIYMACMVVFSVLFFV